ncbi:unnamed protein product [Acanthoscelides obtectus]|uniref:Uncharacterized protein n=1 Tax=Acanthoscelides obtectus TaxID=200917 RepID=A0A9P0L3H7_ACAOB|nr:unnamed protein product [Acanthoscelides obtectus]CAK1674455.1 hypothetical protein AOBTE_LOCUS29626 [Acanthoscelides obtectus]
MYCDAHDSESEDDRSLARFRDVLQDPLVGNVGISDQVVNVLPQNDYEMSENDAPEYDSDADPSFGTCEVKLCKE